MYAPVIVDFGDRGDVGCVAVVPDVALVSEVVEGCDCENDRDSGDAPSAYGGHCGWWLCRRWIWV